MHVALLCATPRGYLFPERLSERLPRDELGVFEMLNSFTQALGH